HVCYFFFQAEDGIRDPLVTGVQTCALPIFEGVRVRLAGCQGRRDEDPSLRSGAGDEVVNGQFGLGRQRDDDGCRGGSVETAAAKIGRASCRERVWGSGWGGCAAEGGGSSGG